MSVYTILFLNLVPLLGVIFLGWSGGMIASLYAIETVLIGILNVVKMIMVERIGDDYRKSETNAWVAKLFIIPFFIFHYGVFVLVQGAVIIGFSLTMDKSSMSKWQFIAVFSLSLLSILVGQCLMFWRDYIKPKTYKTANLGELMFEPYQRVFIQQFVVIFGMMLMLVFKLQYAMAFLLVFLKTMHELAKNRKKGEGLKG